MKEEKEVRLEKALTKEGLEKLHQKKVLLIGLGGVGGLLGEALIRSGITHLDVVDGDIVEESNFNRQIIALDSTLKMKKTAALKQHLIEIDKSISIEEYPFFIDENTINQISFANYDLVLDCIDDVMAKVLIIQECKKTSTEIISCMGTANKTNPNSFEICDINQTSYCPLAKKIRLELRKRKIDKVKVCYSKEPPQENHGILASQMFIVGSASFIIAKAALDYLLSI